MPKKSMRLYVKIVLCIIYLVVMAILFVSAYKIYNNDRREIPWEKVTSTRDYTSLEISKMSEAFATIDKNKQIHFVIVTDSEEVYYSYLIAIDKKSYKNYKELIDYSYGRIEEQPNTIKVFGYPRKINNTLKKLTLENYQKFLPNDNSVVLNKKNFNKYLTDTYLDTTIKKGDNTNLIVILLLTLILGLFILLIATLKKEKIKEKIEII